MATAFIGEISASGRQEQSSALRRLFDRTVVAYLRYAAASYERYQARLHLEQMSDEMLNDIGITRYDITGKVSGRF